MAVTYKEVSVEIRSSEDGEKLSLQLSSEGGLLLIVEDGRYREIAFSFDDLEAIRRAASKLWEVKAFLEKI